MKDVQHPMILKRSIVGIASVEWTCLYKKKERVVFSFGGFFSSLTYLTLLDPKA